MEGDKNGGLSCYCVIFAVAAVVAVMVRFLFHDHTKYIERVATLLSFFPVCIFLRQGPVLLFFCRVSNLGAEDIVPFFRWFHVDPWVSESAKAGKPSGKPLCPLEGPAPRDVCLYII